MEQKATPVLVTLTSSAHSEGGDQDTPIRLRCQGQLKQTVSGFMLRYQEIQTDDETGKTVSQDVILGLQPDRVTMTRLGAFGTTMVFVKDRRFEGAYHTSWIRRAAMQPCRPSTSPIRRKGRTHADLPARAGECSAGGGAGAAQARPAAQR